MSLEQIIIVLLIAAVLILSVYVFSFLQQKRVEETVAVRNSELNMGNAQLLGDNDYQNDYFAVINKEATVMATVADGIGDQPDGKYTSVMAVEVFKKNFEQYLLDNDLITFFAKSIFRIKKYISDSITNNHTGVKLITLIIKDKRIEFLSVGDCVAFVVRNKQILYINNIHDSKLLTNTFMLKRKDIVVVCTRSIFEPLSEKELLHTIVTRQHPQYKCEELIKRVHRKPNQNGQNGTIIILENIEV